MASREILHKNVVRALRKLGFLPIHQKGSHVRLGHTDGRRVTVALHPKPLSLGTLDSILRQAEIIKKEIDAMKKCGMPHLSYCNG